MQPIFDLDWIKSNHSESTEYVYFWNQINPDSRACFNQWHPSPFVYKGFRFANAEQAMMADKAAMFGDFGALAELFLCTSPRAAKAIGRSVKGYVDSVWSEARFHSVLRINIHKFAQNPTMRAALLATGNVVLVEASPKDCIWGIGLTEQDPRSADPANWLGQNLLGSVLMQVRYVLASFDDPLSEPT